MKNFIVEQIKNPDLSFLISILFVGSISIAATLNVDSNILSLLFAMFCAYATGYFLGQIEYHKYYVAPILELLLKEKDTSDKYRQVVINFISDLGDIFSNKENLENVDTLSEKIANSLEEMTNDVNELIHAHNDDRTQK